jgi:hypothetical protein
MWYSNLEKTFISWHVLHQHWYTCPIALPVRRNPQHRSLLTVVQPLPHLGFNKHFPPYTGNTSLWTSFALSPFAHKKYKRTLFFGQARLPCWLLQPSSEHAHARLLPGLSRSWTVLVPNDSHSKPITSITAVFLPFVTYLLTLPRIESCVGSRAAVDIREKSLLRLLGIEPWLLRWSSP